MTPVLLYYLSAAWLANIVLIDIVGSSKFCSHVGGIIDEFNAEAPTSSYLRCMRCLKILSAILEVRICYLCSIPLNSMYDC